MGNCGCNPTYRSYNNPNYNWEGPTLYLHETHKESTIHVGKYTSPMDGMGMVPLQGVNSPSLRVELALQGG